MGEDSKSNYVEIRLLNIKLCSIKADWWWCISHPAKGTRVWGKVQRKPKTGSEESSPNGVTQDVLNSSSFVMTSVKTLGLSPLGTVNHYQLGNSWNPPPNPSCQMPTKGQIVKAFQRIAIPALLFWFFFTPSFRAGFAMRKNNICGVS